MWLCTQLGFFSIVRQSRNTFYIHARCVDDLENLCQFIGLPTPEQDLSVADDPGHIRCDPTDLTRFFALLASSITYDDFESAIAHHPRQRAKLDAYRDIHHRMARWHAHPKS